MPRAHFHRAGVNGRHPAGDHADGGGLRTCARDPIGAGWPARHETNQRSPGRRRCERRSPSRGPDDPVDRAGPRGDRRRHAPPRLRRGVSLHETAPRWTRRRHHGAPSRSHTSTVQVHAQRRKLGCCPRPRHSDARRQRRPHRAVRPGGTADRTSIADMPHLHPTRQRWRLPGQCRTSQSSHRRCHRSPHHPRDPDDERDHRTPPNEGRVGHPFAPRTGQRPVRPGGRHAVVRRADRSYGRTAPRAPERCPDPRDHRGACAAPRRSPARPTPSLSRRSGSPCVTVRALVHLPVRPVPTHRRARRADGARGRRASHVAGDPADAGGPHRRRPDPFSRRGKPRRHQHRHRRSRRREGI